MAHVVIIGAGIGGVPCAYELRKRLGEQHRVTLIGALPHFEFTPSNPWIAVGWRSPEQTRVELRQPLETKGIQWISEPVTWARVGKWVHLAKIAFEKHFLRKVRTGSVTPVYEKYVLKALGIVSLKKAG
jgi:NADH dehydrogenase FAD-containing subunit